MNRLFYGDNLEVLRRFVRDESVDLVYIDPPFNSKRNYNQIYNNVGKEDLAQVQAFVDTWEWNLRADAGFKEVVGNYNGVFTAQSIELIIGFERVLGRGTLLAYLVSVTLRLVEVWRVLKPTGSFYLHCDPTASHYLKLVCDAIFVAGRGGEFQNELIWCYSIGGKSKKRFGEKHDVIFYYTKCKDDLHKFDKLGAKIPRKANSHMKAGTDADGREFQEKKDKKTGKVYRYYLDEGKIAEDYWIDIEALNYEDKERLGYPTQKPERLLERIIKTSSNEGDVVMDCYCGCGTAVAVAQRLGRQWIGVDITFQSISLILRRLEFSFGKEVLKEVQLSGIPKDLESAVALAKKEDDRLRKEFEKWVILTFSNNLALVNDKKGGDGGIDGLCFVGDLDEKGAQAYKRVLFSVKSNKMLSPSVVRDLNGAMEREGAVMGFLLTLYRFENLEKESGKYGSYDNQQFGKSFKRIEVVCVEDIMGGRRLDLPISIEVLKKAESKVKGKQGELGEG